MKQGKGCLQVIGGLVVLLVIIGVIAAATSKHSSSNGTSISLPANTTTQSVSASTPEPGPFSGQGDENLGTVRVPDNTVLNWSCPSCAGSNGDNFIVDNSPGDGALIDVNSLDQGSGQTVVDGGVYHDVSVTTEGSAWTLTFVHK